MLKGNLNKILFVVSYCYVLGVVLLLVSQNKLYLPFISDSLNHNNSTKQPPSESDVRFIDYMKRSLKKIDRTRNQPALTTTESSPVTPQTDRYTPISPITQLPTQTSPPIAVIPPPPPPTTNPPPPTNLAPTTSAPNQLNQNNYSLIGLFEAGDNSVALFDFKGVVSRITQGQPIGSSGWVLESVTADQAVVAKGQEKRILTVGQKL